MHHSSTKQTAAVAGNESRAAANHTRHGISRPAATFSTAQLVTAVIQLSPEENEAYKKKWLAELLVRYDPKAFVRAILKLANTADLAEEEQRAHIASAKALYLEALSNVTEKADAVSTDLTTGKYQAAITSLEPQFAHWVEVPEQRRQYETIRADGASILKGPLSDEGIEKFSALTVEKDNPIRFSTAGIGDEAQLRKVVLAYELSGFLQPGKEVHARTQIATRESKGLFEPDIPIFGDIIIYKSATGQIDVRVLSQRIRPGESVLGEQVDPEKTKKLQEELIGTYRLKPFVAEGGKTWSLHDLMKLQMALSRLPVADRDALQDVAFVRVAELDRDATGRTLGAFRSGYQVREIRLGDGTFDADAVAFIGSGLRKPPISLSAQTILHETGHAVAGKQQLDARDKVITLRASLEKLEREKSALPRPAAPSGSLFEVADEDIGRDIQVLLGKGLLYRMEKFEALRSILSDASATADLKTFANEDDTKDKVFIDALQEMMRALNRMLTEGSTAAHQLFLEKSKLARAAGQGLLEEDRFREVTTAIAGYREGAEGIIQDIYASKTKEASAAHTEKLRLQAVRQKEYEAQQKEYEERKGEYDRATAGMELRITAMREAIAEARAALEKYSYPAKEGYSSRVKKFVDFVVKAGIKPEITDYAGDSWKLDNPEEFFAEAYSIWLNDPVFLQKNYLALYVWFEEGKYRD